MNKKYWYIRVDLQIEPELARRMDTKYSTLAVMDGPQGIRCLRQPESDDTYDTFWNLKVNYPKVYSIIKDKLDLHFYFDKVLESL